MNNPKGPFFDVKDPYDKASWSVGEEGTTGIGINQVNKLSFVITNQADHDLDDAFRETVFDILDDAFKKLNELEKKHRK